MASISLPHKLNERLTWLWESPNTLYGMLATVDHKILGKRYMATAMAFLVAAGIEALFMRLQLSRSEMRLMNPETYNQLFTMHGSTMIFWYASPILSGFSIYLIPLMIGARDLAFPRLNSFTYWLYLFSGVFLYASMVTGHMPHDGWFAYAPYSEPPYSPGPNMDFWAIALILFTISTSAGGINLLVTIWRHRAPGMSINRMPVMAFSTSTMSMLGLISLGPFAVALTFLLLDRKWGFHFFDPTHAGSAILWQHLFWFFAHPWVYIIFLPATGMISMIIPTFARRPLVGYTYVVLSTMLTGVVGFGVYVHHMFAIGMDQLPMNFFSAASMSISIFTTIQVFAWIATLWTGRPVMTTSLLFALGFIANIIIGGLDGVITAVIPVDWQLTDTYWVVAHLHYVLIGANLFPVMAGFYYWLPKMTGRMMNETAGRWSFWLMFVGFNVGFFPQHILGLLGMPRRIYTYPAGMGWSGLNLISTLGAAFLAVGIMVSLWNFLWSSRNGEVAGPDPWKGDTLEWSTESPPPVYGSAHIPTIRSRNPMWDDHREEYDPEGVRELSHYRLTLSTSALDAVPIGVAKMPEDSLLPLLLAGALTVIAIGVLLDALWVAAAFVVVSLVVTGLWMWPKEEKHA